MPPGTGNSSGTPVLRGFFSTFPSQLGTIKSWDRGITEVGRDLWDRGVCQPSTSFTTDPWPQVPHPLLSGTFPGIETPPLHSAVAL